jgi:hypothetical protein
VLDGVDGDRHLGTQPVVSSDRPQGFDVDARVGDEHVADPGGDEPDRLGHGIRHDAGEPRAGEHPVEQGTAPQ